LPKLGARVSAHQAFGVVESVKAVSDLFAPISGEIVEINEELRQTPQLVNQDPYGRAWMIVVKAANAADVDQLLTAAQYEQFVAEGAH
jgi:glycine cleavage system H protein